MTADPAPAAIPAPAAAPGPTQRSSRSRARGALCLAVLGSLGVLAVASCGDDVRSVSSTAPSDALRPVTLVLDWTPNTNHSGFYLAKASGAYEREGLDVRIVEPGTDLGLAQVAAGTAEFAVSYAEAVLPARAEGQNVVSIATILAHNTSSIAVPADRGVTRPRELAALRYGGYGGPLELALVRGLVACDGGDPSKLRTVEIGNTDLRVGLERKDYDAVWIFDGWDGIRLREIDGLDLVTFPLLGSCIPDWYTPVLVSSDALIASDPDLVQRFVRATASGYETARQDPNTAADTLLAAVPELDKALVVPSARALASSYGDTGRAWGVQDRAVWSEFHDFLRAQNILSKDVNVDQVFTSRFTDAAAVPVSSRA